MLSTCPGSVERVTTFCRWFFGAEVVTSSVKEQIHELQDEPFVFFCKQADLYVINKAILYVR